ncbi:MAG TPA: DUF4270 domain-containing protein [Candidatus Bacteroides pullicola]|uniref:DUF4270 domain-containing protein n=1 Tax=Candidatus Bacteroides pullicola TaxID=2838475 RepID=A0A9D1ZJM0_9BACE|nr:DUF4270 domain-containing protein [Candidatus Bacteroides pullicola]
MKRLLLLCFLAASLCACVDENSDLGHTLVDSSFYNVYVDTCTVDISTVLEDSIVTRGDSICQIGHYRDDTWGAVTATYYAEYSTASFTPDEDCSYTLDSLVLVMKHSGHYWGDTLTRPGIRVYRLATPIELADDDDLYNHSTWVTESTPLFSFTYRPRPGEARVQEIRLPDAWGQQLLDDLVNQEEYFDSQEDFKREFPGLAFVPDENAQCISGFLINDSSLCLTLHYHEVGIQRTEKELTFSVNTDCAYTGIRHDRTGSPLSRVRSGIENYVHSTDLGHRAYLQGLTGYYNQLEFPYLNELQDAGQIVSIESATLYLYPLKGSYNRTNQLPEDIRLYITDENNVLEDYVYGSDGVTVQTGNLTVDEVFGRDTYYSFDLTEFIRNNFGTWGINRQKLLMNMNSSDAATTFNQVVFTNDPDTERKCRLDVRFKIYNEQ